MKRAGFTLIELLIVTAVFSVLFLIGTGVYTNDFSKQKIVQAKQRVAAEARAALETISRSVRVGSIDYTYYRTGCGGVVCDLTRPQTVIAVRDSANIQTCFGVNGLQQLVTTTTCSQPIANWSVITPDDLVVKDFQGWIIPAANPFLGPPTTASDCRVPFDSALKIGFDSTSGVCGCRLNSPSDCWIGQTCDPTALICKNPNQQPLVTLGFSLKTAPGTTYIALSHLQTSIVTRTYQR